jgi:hypothetical protein
VLFFFQNKKVNKTKRAYKTEEEEKENLIKQQKAFFFFLKEGTQTKFLKKTKYYFTHRNLFKTHHTTHH